jgi:hypothetical protein
MNGLNFPKNRQLSGEDCFFLAMDSSVKKLSGRSNICRMTFDFGEQLSLTSLEQACRQNKVIDYLSRLRVKSGLVAQIPRWVEAKEGELSIDEHQSDAAFPEALLAQSINPYKNTLLRLDLMQRSNGHSRLIFSWAHILMDSHGAELLMKDLGACQNIKNTEDYFAEILEDNERFVDKLNNAKVVKDFISDPGKGPFVNLTDDIKQFRSPLTYHSIDFNQEETKTIDDRSKASPAKFLKSLYFLSATARAFSEALISQGKEIGNLLVPVPQDERKRGTSKPVVANAVGFMFFRIPAKVLHSSDDTTIDLVDQMKSQMKIKLQKNYKSFTSLCRRLPIFIYNKILNSPAKGNMASFIFSDTGNSLNDFTSFLSLELECINHFPPNTCPPGFTVVFARHKDCLKITLAYMSDLLDETALNTFEKALRSDLLAYET